MDGRGRPVKREQQQGNPVRDAQGNLVYEDEPRQRAEADAPQMHNSEGVREAQGARRPSTTMGTDSAAPLEQLARVDSREEQDELMQRRRNGQRRGSRTNLEEVIESNSAIPASSFIHALQQQRQQQMQMQQQMTAGGLKTFPSRGLTPSAALEPAFDWNEMPPSVSVGDADVPPSEPERPIASRGRRPSIGQLF